MINLNENDFKLNFPEFKDAENVEFCLERAKCYLSSNGNKFLTGEKYKLALYLFAAHFLVLQKNIAEGQLSAGLPSSASINSVSISMVPPSSSGAFEYWLNQTQYGAELLALLEHEAPVPLLLGGSFVRVLF